MHERCGGLLVRALDSRLNVLDSSPAWDILLCFCTFLPTQAYKCLPANLMLGEMLWCTTDDDQIVSHDAIFYVHDATSKLSVISS